MTIACVIPARYTSRRLPGKLLKQAHGKSVLQSTWEAAQRCPLFDQIYIATDDERIAAHAHALGACVVWTSSSCLNGTERIGEALRNHPPLQQAQLIVNLQGDHPCTESSTLTALIETLHNHPKAVVATPITPIVDEALWHSPHCVKVVCNVHREALYFSRSPIPFGTPRTEERWGHIGTYAYRKEFFSLMAQHPPTPLQMAEDLEQLKILELGHTIQVIVVQERLLGIDTQEDFLRWEEMTR